MAGRAQLHTVFTGDDSHFQRTVRRVQGAGQRVAAIGSKLTGALGALGAGVGFKHILDTVDKIEKKAFGLNMTSESLQRLTFVAEQSGAKFEQLQAILFRLKRRTSEALTKPTSAAAEGFKKLGINAEEFKNLSGDQMLYRFADAFKEGGEDVMATGAAMGVLDTEVRELIPMLKLGSEGIKEIGKEAHFWGPEAGAAIEGLKDKFHALANKGIVAAVKMIEKWVKAVEWVTEKIEYLIDTGMGAFLGLTDSNLTVGEGIAGARANRERMKKDKKDREDKIAKAKEKLSDPTGIQSATKAAKSKTRAGGKYGEFEMVAGFAAGGAGAPLASAAKKSQDQTRKFLDHATKNSDLILKGLNKITRGIAT